LVRLDELTVDPVAEQAIRKRATTATRGNLKP
jgi:hypothetical protein